MQAGVDSHAPGQVAMSSHEREARQATMPPVRRVAVQLSTRRLSQAGLGCLQRTAHKVASPLTGGSGQGLSSPAFLPTFRAFCGVSLFSLFLFLFFFSPPTPFVCGCTVKARYVPACPCQNRKGPLHASSPSPSMHMGLVLETRQLLALDHLAHALMKNSASCEN